MKSNGLCMAFYFTDLKRNIMKLEIKHFESRTSLYDGEREVCEFVTGSRQINLKYAQEIVKLFAIPCVTKHALNVETGK